MCIALLLKYCQPFVNDIEYSSAQHTRVDICPIESLAELLQHLLGGSNLQLAQRCPTTTINSVVVAISNRK